MQSAKRWAIGAARALSRLAPAGLLAMATACGGGSGGTASAQVPVVGAGTWAVLGSSSAAGQGVTAGEAWADRLAAGTQAQGVQITNLARSGLLTTQALPVGTPLLPDRAVPDPQVNIDRALTLPPKLVLVSFPTNDVVAGVPPAETVGHWQLIRRRAADAGAATLVLSTQPRDGLDSAQQAALDETDRLAVAAFGECFVPLRAALSDGQGRIAPAYAAGDGIHLNAEGHRVIFEEVKAVVDGGRCVRTAR